MAKKKKRRGFDKLRPNHDQHRSPVVFQRFDDGDAFCLVCGANFLERWRFINPVADPHTKIDQHDGQDERNAPTPGEESLFRERHIQRRGDNIAKSKADEAPVVGTGAIKTAAEFFGWNVISSAGAVRPPPPLPPNAKP